MKRTYLMSVEQLCTIIAALMLASCVKVHAQFGVEQPMFAMRSTATVVPSAPTTNLAYYWVASDIGAGAVTNWTDRIQGKLLTQANSSSRPNATTNAVSFGGATHLTNNTFSVLAPYTMVWISAIRTNIPANYRWLINNINNSLAAILWDSSAVPYSYDSTINPMGTANFTSARIQDFALNVLHNGVSDAQFYTNNLASKTNVFFNDWAATLMLGFNSGANSAPVDLYELAIYTNVIWPGTVASNYHYYATNTYLFSP